MRNITEHKFTCDKAKASCWCNCGEWGISYGQPALARLNWKEHQRQAISQTEERGELLALEAFLKRARLWNERWLKCQK